MEILAGRLNKLNRWQRNAHTMNLEEQVVSLDLAKRLKKFRMKQESAFFWEDAARSMTCSIRRSIPLPAASEAPMLPTTAVTSTAESTREFINSVQSTVARRSYREYVDFS